MLKEGLQLTEAVEEIKIGSDTIYKIANGVMYIFLGRLNNEVIESIVEMKKEAQELFDDPALDWRYPCRNLAEDGEFCEL